MRQLAELLDVLLGNAQRNRFLATLGVDRFGNATQTFGGRSGDQLDLAGLTFGFVDLTHLVGFGQVDGFLLLAFGDVDLGFTFPFGLGHHGATLPLGAHLLLQRIQNGCRQFDIGNFVAQDFHAPGLGGFI